MKIDNLLTKAKQGLEAGQNDVEGDKQMLYSSDEVELYQVEGKELPTYVAKKTEKEKLAAVLGDPQVRLVQVSTGKPVLVMHSKHGAMQGDFTLSTSAAGKMLKTIELPPVVVGRLDHHQTGTLEHMVLRGRDDIHDSSI